MGGGLTLGVYLEFSVTYQHPSTIQSNNNPLQEFQSILRQATLMSALLSKNVGDIGCDTCVSLAGLVQKEVLANEVILLA